MAAGAGILRRWAIEETLRYVKQSYELEDVRVLNYRSLQNIMPLVCAVAYFAAVLLDPRLKTESDRRLRVEGGKAFVWDSRLSLLQHCRRSNEHFHASSGENYKTDAASHSTEIAVPLSA